MKVPFYDLEPAVRHVRTALHATIDRVGHYARSDGPLVKELEHAVGRYTGAEHCIAVGCGTDALAIMLRAAGIGPGDEVIVPAYSFFATASAVVHVGARPVFVDISPRTYAMDPQRVREAITQRTAAIMPVHLFAQLADLSQLRQLAHQHGLLLLEDSAEAIGMTLDGKHGGCWGAAGVLSFFPTKTLGAFGDAGMVITNSPDIASTARRLATDGAWASACDELAASILLFRMASLDDEILERGSLAARYTEALHGLDAVECPQLVARPEAHTAAWYVYLIECARRDQLAAYLAERGIETETYYPRPLTAQPCFDDENSVRHPAPVATAASKKALALPLYPGMPRDHQDHVCAAIAAFYGDQHA